jgi:hypothetical protein
VSLEVPSKNKHYITPLQRYTLSVASSSILAAAYQQFTERRHEFGITCIEPIKDNFYGTSFLLSDLDRNWWEIAVLKS